MNNPFGKEKEKVGSDVPGTFLGNGEGGGTSTLVRWVSSLAHTLVGEGVQVYIIKLFV